MTQHELNGTVTGLAATRTLESTIDGLDRLIVSFKDAKVKKVLVWTASFIADFTIRWHFWNGQEGISQQCLCIRTSDALK